MLELSFESGEESLSPRSFVAREAVSTLFMVDVEAVAPGDDLRFDGIVGGGAALRVREGDSARLFRGVCSRAELARVEPSGLSTYRLRIVPSLWLLTQRRNHRLFQHATAVDIARALLAEWGLDAAFRVDEALHPKRELRLQYGEPDFDFLCRLLDEAGLAFVFPNREEGPPLLISDDLHAAGSAGEPRSIPFVDDASTARDLAHVTDVRLSQEVTPGRFTIRDSDFRRSATYELVGVAVSGAADDRLEHYDYRPGAFLVEPSAQASGPASAGSPREDVARSDDKGARSDEKEGHAQAARALGRARSAKRVVSFRTNVTLAAGAVVSIARHPRSELGARDGLLVTEMLTEGTAAGDVRREARAGFAQRGEPWLPPLRAEKPRMNGVQSAVVVGPAGQEIHTDDLGRVRVQFPWDREGRFDERSSCWLRVSHGWAGGAYGMLALPRVGQEVLVGFVDGDPDQPIVVGRVYNTASAPPYKLPENATISTWKSASSPGGAASNEILFEDAAGGERLFVGAGRDLERAVKRDEATSVGRDRRDLVGGDESIEVRGARAARVGASDTVTVAERHAVTVASAPGATVATGSEMVDGRITFTTGQASLTLEGPNVTLEAAAGILLKAATDIALVAQANITAHADVSLTLGAGATLTVRSEAGDVVIQGGPIVRINPEVTSRSALAADGVDAPPEVPPGVDLDEDIALAETHARFDPSAPSWFDDQRKAGGPWDHARLGPRYAAFASFHYGVVGRAMGFPEGALLHQAGARRAKGADATPDWGDPGNGLSGGTYPYGADPRDQEMTRRGFAFYARRYG
jgi:type VI secretion system secreted protein VgrG